MTKAFAPGFKQQMVQRLIGKNAMTVAQLRKEVGVPQTTLHRWLREASSLGEVTTPKRLKIWSVAEKIKVLAEVAELPDAELSAALEKHGLRSYDVEQWRLALDQEGRASTSMTKQIRRLEREVARKDKALAEAAALLLLKKKLQAAFGVEDDDTDEENET